MSDSFEKRRDDEIQRIVNDNDGGVTLYSLQAAANWAVTDTLAHHPAVLAMEAALKGECGTHTQCTCKSCQEKKHTCGICMVLEELQRARGAK